MFDLAADGRSPLFSPNFLTRIGGASSCALTCSRYRGQSKRLGHGRMKATGRIISAPARKLLLNLLVEERAGSLGRRPLCRRCLRTLHCNARILQNIRTLSPARKRHDPILSCCFWHEETRRRHLATLQTRSLATVHEGTLFQVPLELGQTDSPRSILNIFVMKGALTRDAVPNSIGPLEEYDERVHSRRLRDDEHQRCTVATTQERWKLVS